MIRIPSKEYEEEKLKEFDEDYNGYMGAQLKELEENEKTLLEKCQENGQSHPQVWSLVEKCRDEFTWRPLRFNQEKLLNVAEIFLKKYLFHCLGILLVEI